MNKYIKIYTEAYTKFKILGTKNIKTQLIDHKKNLYSNYYHANNTILSNFQESKKKSIINKPPFIALNRIFQNRFDKLEEKYNLTVIPNTLLPMFNDLDSNKAITFTEFITELARIESQTELHRLFTNYFNTYQMMYELERFNDFELIQHNLSEESTPLFKEYHTILYKKNDELIGQEEAKGEKSTIIKEEPINFSIREQYKEKFKTCYSELTYLFINDDKTTYEDFCNVFLKNTTSHSSKIYFLCGTKLAVLLLHELGKHIFTKLNQVNISKSGMFVSKSGNPFSQSTFSRTKNNVNEQDISDVSSIIQILQN